MISVHTQGLNYAEKYSEGFISEPLPYFAYQNEDIQKLNLFIDPFLKYPKIIVLGDAIAVNTFAFYARSLKGNGKKVFILNSSEVDLINNIKNEFTQLDTLIVCISQSGDERVLVESVLQLSDYPAILITHNSRSALGKIAQHNGWAIFDSSSTTDRFSSVYAPSLIPALLFGIPIDRIQKGAHDMYELCSMNTRPNENPAWIIAHSLYRAELIEKNILYISLHSYYLETVLSLFIQLVHDITVKDDKGWTASGEVGSGTYGTSHNRLLKGKKNIVGIFITVHNQRDQESKVSIPRKLLTVTLGTSMLANINDSQLKNSVTDEYKKLEDNARRLKVPFIHIELDRLNSYTIGQLIALWQMAVYYMARLINVDPFE